MVNAYQEFTYVINIRIAQMEGMRKIVLHFVDLYMITIGKRIALYAMKVIVIAQIGISSVDLEAAYQLVLLVTINLIVMTTVTKIFVSFMTTLGKTY